MRQGMSVKDTNSLSGYERQREEERAMDDFDLAISSNNSLIEVLLGRPNFARIADYWSCLSKIFLSLAPILVEMIESERS